MTSLAAFRLDRLMFENEWPLLVGVAREANRIPSRRGPKLLPDETSVGVMAISALHQTFFHTMVEGHVELRLHLDVARVAEFRLRFR